MNIGDIYIIRVDIEGKTFTYTGKVLSEDDDFVTFLDKYGITFSYNKNKIISFEKVKVKE